MDEEAILLVRARPRVLLGGLFDLRNQLTGTGFLLTAGHCVRAGERIAVGRLPRIGSRLGPCCELVRHSTTSSATTIPSASGPWVDVTPSNGRSVPVTGFTDGRTFVQVGHHHNMDIRDDHPQGRDRCCFDGVKRVHGTARAWKGDSGGSNVSVSSSVYAAEGMTGGASLRSDGSRLRCLSALASRTCRGTSRSRTAWPTTARDSASASGSSPGSHHFGRRRPSPAARSSPASAPRVHRLRRSARRCMAGGAQAMSPASSGIRVERVRLSGPRSVWSGPGAMQPRCNPRGASVRATSERWRRA